MFFHRCVYLSCTHITTINIFYYHFYATLLITTKNTIHNLTFKTINCSCKSNTYHTLLLCYLFAVKQTGGSHYVQCTEGFSSHGPQHSFISILHFTKIHVFYEPLTIARQNFNTFTNGLKYCVFLSAFNVCLCL